MGKVLRDMPVLCWDRVRYIGDRVAAVAAETPEAAEEALLRIDVDYEVLPAVFDPMEAMRPDALCSMMMSRPTPERRSTCWRRTCTTVKRGWRGPKAMWVAFARPMSSWSTFSVPSRHQGYLEPFTSVIAIDDDGRIQAWCSSKAPFRARVQLAQALGLRDEHIRVNVVSVGGDFGGKGDARDLPVAYLLARWPSVR